MRWTPSEGRVATDKAGHPVRRPVTGAIAGGDRVLLRNRAGKDWIVEAQSGTVRVPNLGVLRLGDLIGKPWGATVALAGEDYRLLRPLITDHVDRLERGAQIILAKDAARIVLECSLHSGSRVAEAGVGSGALTMVLAHAVAPQGRVFAYDVREDHLDQGRRNVARAGLSAHVEFRVGDVGNGFQETDLDAVVLDLPEPEKVISHAKRALRAGGAIACYNPLVSQVERAVAALSAEGFLDVRALELLERPWKVGERGSRPETTMLAHTGFLVFARNGS